MVHRGDAVYSFLFDETNTDTPASMLPQPPFYFLSLPYLGLFQTSPYIWAPQRQNDTYPVPVESTNMKQHFS